MATITFRSSSRPGPTAPTGGVSAMFDADAVERAERVVARCDALAACTEQAVGITRPYGTAALRRAQDFVAGWMTDAGMTTRRDAGGNLIGRYEGATADAPTLLLGSHLDSVA